MIDDVIIIEDTNKLLDMINSNEKSNTKLMYVQRHLLDMKNTAEKRLKEFEDSEAPSDEPIDHVARARENARIEGFTR